MALTAAMRSEETHLREKFGDAYDAYAQKRAPKVERLFSWQRAIYNRERAQRVEKGTREARRES